MGRLQDLDTDEMRATFLSKRDVQALAGRWFFNFRTYGNF